MIYLYTIITFLASILIMLRTIILIQMNGYILSLTNAIRREFVYNLMIAIILNLLSYSLRYLKNTYVAVAIMIVVLTGITLIMVLRRYKVKPNITPRLSRLISVFVANNILIMSILLLIIAYIRIVYLFFMLINSVFVINYVLLYWVMLIMNSIENNLNKRYIKKAKVRLESLSNIKVIGITGSFAKTTTKNILYNILKEKYKVYATPSSYNTPMGIAMSINNLSGDEEYFIVEMGARHLGDISALCQIVQPQYGIITGVTSQHLLSFHTIDEIEKTKYELYKSIPDDGLCVFNGNNSITTKMYNYSNKDNSILSVNGNYISINDVHISNTGMTFRLKIGEKSINVHSSLIGMHFVDDILLAVTLADKLGLSIDEIARGITMTDAIPHRFEVNIIDDVTIIDDSYNANILGIKGALDTLRLFDGRKIIAVQGIVEGGKSERKLNTLIGSYIADTANIVVLIGKRGKYIYNGLIEKKFNPQNVISVKNLHEAENVFAALIRRGDNLLILNDLPDNY